MTGSLQTSSPIAPTVTLLLCCVHRVLLIITQVIDEEGVDRTPKPLLSVKPSVLRSIGAGVGGDDGTLSPMSEAGSEFFLDRMSSAVFSRGQGGTW